MCVTPWAFVISKSGERRYVAVVDVRMIVLG
jgi:hypothetical protein